MSMLFPPSQKIWVSLVFFLLFSSSRMSDSLRPHELKHARLQCPSLSPRDYSNSCLLNWWCHPAISSSVTPFSSHPQSFHAQGSFPVSRLFPSGSQSIGVSASALPMNIQSWFPLGLTGREGKGNPLQYSCLENPVDRGAWWAAVHGVTQSRTWLQQLSSSSSSSSSRIDWFDLLTVQGTLKSLLQHHDWKTSILQHSTFFMVQLLHLYMTTTSKTIALIIQTLLGKVTSLLFNRLSRFAIAFLPRSKCLLISWLQSRSTWSLWKENRSLLPLFTFYLPWSDRIMAAT